MSRTGRSLSGCAGRSDLSIFIGSRLSLRRNRNVARRLIARDVISDKALIIHNPSAIIYYILLDRAVSERVHYVLL